MNRSGKVFLYNKYVGDITESNDGDYIFKYTQEYFESNEIEGISLTLPKREQEYRQSSLHAFFDGLIPEGWLLNHALKNWKINQNDRMGLLLSMCQSTIGATHIIGPNSEVDKTSLIGGSDLKDKSNHYKTDKCLISYKPLSGNKLYLENEAKKMFGDSLFQSSLNINSNDLEELAKKQTNKRLTLTGVQKKLSLNLAQENISQESRLTIVDFDGNFILKPPTKEYPNMPEIEHLCMRMAKLAGLDVPDCALIPLQSGELAFLIKRFDRKNNIKFYQEDFCQLMEKPTKDKYRSSIEKCSKVITDFCEDKHVNLSLFFDINLYNFIIGNSDMHLKNFSLVKNPKTQKYQLSPCYDFLSTKILISDDMEQTALAINGKKNKIYRKDFMALANHMGLKETFVDNMINKYKKSKTKMFKLIENSFLTQQNKEKLKEIIQSNLKTLE